jgi:pyruvate dehydrogenase E2 component (dihydrolipoamide acetyltransferase)
MATPVRMPQLSLTMTEGMISKWLKQEGDSVAQGEPLFEIETDKVVNEIEAPAAGVLLRIAVPENVSTPIQAVIAVIGAPGEDAGVETAATAASSAATPAASPASAPQAETSAPSGNGARIFVSPRARKMAEERGLSLATMRGSGPGGRIMEKDVTAALAALAARPAPVAAPPATVTAPTPRPAPVPVAQPAPTSGFTTVRMTGMRRVIADRMSASQRETAHVTLTAEVDMGEAARMRGQISAEWEKASKLKLTYTDIIVKAVAKALREYPRINSTLADGEIHERMDVNVGVAVAMGEGLIVPVIRNADKLPLAGISESLRALVERARTGSATSEDLSGGTFTVTNMGMMDVDVFTPIINLPECAILGVGRIADRAVVRDGAIVIRPTMWLSLTFDHRIIDGAPAAQFLKRVKALLENSYLLFV